MDPVVASDESGSITFLNPAAERLLGWDASELCGNSLTSIMPARFRTAHETGFRTFVNTRRANILGRPVRVPALHRDGSEIDIELTLSELRLPAGSEVRPGSVLIIATIRDLRERVELERQLSSQRKSLAQHAAVSVLLSASSYAEAIPKLLEGTARALEWEVAVYWRVDAATGRMTAACTWAIDQVLQNKFADDCRDLSFGPGDGCIGQVLASREPVFLREAQTDPTYVRSELVAAHGLRTALLFPVYCAKTTWGVLEYLTFKIEEPESDLLRTMGALGFQIGQYLARLHTEEELRQARADSDAERDNLRALFMETPAAIAILRGPEFRYTLSNPLNQEIAGQAALMGRTVREALPELEAEGVIGLLQQVYETGQPYVAQEYPVTMPERGSQPARRVYMNGVLQPLRAADGKVDGVMMFSYDVSDLVHSRERMAEAEERLRLAVEAGNLGTWDYDPRTAEVRCDARYKALFGLPPEAEVTASILNDAIHPDDRQHVQAAVEQSFARDNGGEYAVEYRTRGVTDGIERWLAVRGRSYFDSAGNPIRFVGTGLDITRERAAREGLQFLSDASRILASSLDYRTTLTEVAQIAVPRLADWCVIEVLNEQGHTDEVAIKHSNPEKEALAREMRRRYPPDARTTTGVARVISTGKPRLVSEISDAMLVQAARDDEHLRVMRELGLCSSILVPLLLGERAIGALGLYQAESGRRYTEDDVSFAQELGRRAALAIENARLFEASQAATRLRDEFLSIASHELKTPVTSLRLYLEAFARDMQRDDLQTLPMTKMLARVTKANRQVDRLTILISELLDVSRIGSGKLGLERRRMDLSLLVREVVDGFAEQARASGTELQISAAEPVIGAWDKDRLDQVVTNLLTNLLKHAPGKPAQICVERCEDQAVLTISDGGPGLDPQDHLRIFERFERGPQARNIGGFGLGLWIVREIVTAHAGQVRVESAPLQGSQFIVQLPLGSEVGNATV